MSQDKSLVPDRRHHYLNGRELATVLAALRLWQDGVPLEKWMALRGHFADVGHGLTGDEIDILCERLNQ